MAVLLAGVMLAPVAEATVARSFGVRFSTNTTGDIVLRGNAVTTCPVAHPSCADAQSGIGDDAELINNNYEMVYVDVDSDASTFNSSAASLSLPGGSRVLFAGLYWAGDTSKGTGGKAGSPGNRKFVRVLTPLASGYVKITGTVDEDAHGAGPGETAAYQAFADVTSLVAGAGSGTYTVADVQTGTGKDRWAGWALVVAYEHSGLPSRSLTVFDGYGALSPESGTGRTLTIPVSGFQTPPAGSVRTRIGTVIWEGELGHQPEAVTLNGRALTDARNPADNLPNSTISDLGVAVTARNPAYADTLGVDIDRVAADGFLPNSATSAVINMDTGEDVLYPGVFTFATDLFAPTLVASKSAADLNGGTVRPGDVIEFTTTIDNNGMDASRETVLTDTVPAYTTFVPGSLRIGTTARTDAADGDPAGFDSASRVATFRLGTGADGTHGGKLGVGARESVRFQATVNADAAHLASVINVANISYLGDQTGLVLSGTSNVTTSTVEHPMADLRITKSGTPATVVAGSGGTVTYTLSVTNDGPLTDPGVTVTDTLPAGVSVTSASASQGTCSTAGQTLTCTLGALAPGPTVTVSVQAAVGASAADPATDQAAVSGTYHDPDPADNGDTLATATTRAPRAVNDAAGTDTDAAVTVAVLANDTDPDPGDTLGVSTVTNGAHGTAVANTGGTVTYTPGPGFTGSDTFTYTVSDGRGGTATATVTVAVRNAPPGAAPDPATTTLGTPVGIPVLANDTDPNGDRLSISAFDTASGHGGTVAGDDNGTPADPSDDRLVYTPPAGFKGTDTFAYTLADGRGGTAVGTVTVEVPDAAPAALDDAATTPYLTPVTVAVLGNDSDPNGDALTVEAGTVGQPRDAGGTVRGMVERTPQELRYIPPAGFVGAVTFAYRATDGSASDPATVAVTVDNATPTAVDDGVATPYLTAVTFDPRGGDSDANGDPLQVTGISPTTAGGAAALNGDGTVTYTPQVGFSGDDAFIYTVDDGRGATATATVRVTVADAAPVAADDERSTPISTAVDIPVALNDTDANPDDTLTVTAVGVPRDGGGNAQGSVVVSADGRTVTYTPPAGFQGAVTFPYTVADGRGGTATATVRVAVVNDHPTALDDGGITDPATAITLVVVANDSDPNGDPLTLSGVIQAGHGTVTFDPAAGSVTYTPVPTYAGIDTFSYTLADGRGGSGTAQVTVTVLDAFPVAIPDVATTARGVAATIDVMANDTDPNGDVLSLDTFQDTTD
ncbi:MAG: Ig-like domain-containing protein, partial [Acidimicrobiales bacterium]